MNIASLQPTNGESTFLSEETIILPAWTQRRVSTKHQVGRRVQSNGETRFEEKASLEEQSVRCKEAVVNYRGNCPVCYKEIRLDFAGESVAKGESGRNIERTDIEEILKNASAGAYKVLITTDNDRLARRRSVAVLMREKLKGFGIQIYSLSQPIPLKCPDCYDPYFDDTATIIETMSDMKSQLDINKIRRNYKIGMPKRIESGKPTGSLAYGLMKKFKKVDEDVNGNDILEEYYRWDRKKTAIVRRIASEYMSGKGVWGICRDLNADGIPASRGGKWRRSAILHLLKNPVYAGYNRFGWKPVIKGKRKLQPREKWMVRKACFKGIWNLGYYEQLQEELKRRAKTGGRAVSSDALLIGILKCAYCKYSMIQIKGGKLLKDGTPYVWVGYGCGTFLQTGVCKHNGIKQEKLDQIVINEILKLADKNTRREFYKKFRCSKKQDYKKLLEQKKNKLSRLLRKFERLNKAYLNEVDTLEEYSKKKSALLPEIESLKSEVSTLSNKVKNPVKLNWTEVYEDSLKKFAESPTKEDKKKTKIILARLIHRVEFRRKPFSVKIFYKTG